MLQERVCNIENPFRRGDITYYRPQPSNASQSEIDKFAGDLFNRSSMKPGEGVQTIIESVGGRVHSVDLAEWNRTQSGSIVFHGKEKSGNYDFDVIIANFEGELRRRFTLAHELGHLLLHTKDGSEAIIAPRFISAIDSPGNSTDDTRAEWEANWFAAGFLMPEDLFRKQWKELNGSLYRMSAFFMVSEKAIEIRRGVLGI